MIILKIESDLQFYVAEKGEYDEAICFDKTKTLILQIFHSEETIFFACSEVDYLERVKESLKVAIGSLLAANL